MSKPGAWLSFIASNEDGDYICGAPDHGDAARAEAAVRIASEYFDNQEWWTGMMLRPVWIQFHGRQDEDSCRLRNAWHVYFTPGTRRKPAFLLEG